MSHRYAALIKLLLKINKKKSLQANTILINIIPALGYNAVVGSTHLQEYCCNPQSLLAKQVHQEDRTLPRGNTAGHLICPGEAADRTGEMSSDSCKQ